MLSDWLKGGGLKPTMAAIVSALRAKSVNYRQLADDLKQKHATDQTLSCSSTVTPTDKLVSQSSLHFRCPCGICDLDSYLDSGCPMTTSQTYPYLELTKLSDDDKEDLVQTLSQDTANILESFADLITETSRSFRERKVDVKVLVNTSLSLGAFKSINVPKPLLSDVEEQLLKADSIDMVFIILRRHI